MGQCTMAVLESDVSAIVHWSGTYVLSLYFFEGQLTFALGLDEYFACYFQTTTERACQLWPQCASGL